MGAGPPRTERTTASLTAGAAGSWPPPTKISVNLLYATDKEKYDRGYYFRFDELPFPLAQNEEELIDTIKGFNQEKYDRNLKKFFDKEIGLFENGTSSRSLSEWMVNRRIS